MLRADSLKGMKVTDQGGTDIGKIEDVVIDEDGWHVAHLLVVPEKAVLDALDMSWKRYRGSHLKIGAGHIRAIGDVVLLSSAILDIPDLLDT